MLFRFAADFFGAGCATGLGRTGCSTPAIGGDVLAITVGDDDGDADGGVAWPSAATTFRGRFAAVFFGTDCFGFGSEALSAVATGDFRRVGGARFFAGPVRDSAGGVSLVGTATGRGANGNSPVMASLVTSSVLVAPESCGGLIGLAMTGV